MNEPRRQISEERKQLYNVGNAVTILGLVIFLSSFVTGIVAPIGHAAFTAFGFQAVVGFVLVLVGSALRNIGMKGLAGSGAILDPERARQEIEPLSRMAGGVIDDALSEVKMLNSAGSKGGAEAPTV
jgi:hypothetical protein